MNPIISVVVAVYNDSRIERCLKSLVAQSFSQEYELIVVENGTHERYKEVCSRYKAKYVSLDEKNMARARIQGVLESNGLYVLFTDSDCVMHKDWIRQIYLFLEKNNISGAGGRIKRYNPKTKAELYGENLAAGQKTLQSYQPIIDLPYVVLANAGFRRAALLEVGLFDETLLSGNDVDICWKLILKGHKIGICDSALVYHENRKSAKSIFMAHFKYSVYQILLFDKYMKEIKSYKKKKGKLILFNTYPLALLLDSTVKLAMALVKKAFRKKSNPYIYFYRIIESLGILSGIAYGSVKFRKLPFY
jgi:O-antigen biosynthesis protein